MPGEVLPSEICRCHSEPPSTVVPESGRDSESSPASAPVASEVEYAAGSSPDSSNAWRDELSTRLSQYRARRKARPPRYPSLRLPFEPVVAVSGTETATPGPRPVFETISVSAQALALDIATEAAPAEANRELSAAVEQPASRSTSSPAVHSGPGAGAGAKIIEFPRFAFGPPPPPPPDQLAEPVFDRPRILEVPEAAPPLPALGGITMEAQQAPQAEKRPGIDVPLRTSSPVRRALASTIDALIVAAATALFGFIFWKVVGVQPPKFQLVGLALGIPALFWAAYQYLLITYAASTPGLRLAGLRLASFDDASVRRSRRRWRVLASYLSAASLGMGYVWVFLDEDGLCWHDRATRTHLARK
jgi:uncharacterized RDD family membrane protein YckC